MPPTVENIVALVMVGAAVAYVVARLRGVAAGQSKCVCGSNSCGGASVPCETGGKGESVCCGNGTGLPIVPSGCNQGRCGGGKG